MPVESLMNGFHADDDVKCKERAGLRNPSNGATYDCEIDDLDKSW